jgi:hypothetical protein
MVWTQSSSCTVSDGWCRLTNPGRVLKTRKLVDGPPGGNRVGEAYLSVGENVRTIS